MQQKILDALRLRGQHFLNQVFQQRAVAARKGVQEPGLVLGVGTALQGQGCQPQAGRPAFGARDQSPGRSRLQGVRDVHFEEIYSLLHGKPQVRRPQIVNLASGPEPGERQGRVAADQKHRVETRGEMFDQEGHPRVDVCIVNKMIILENEQDPPRAARKGIDQGGEGRFEGRGLGGFQPFQSPGAGLGINGFNRGEDIAPEPVRVVIARIEGDPGCAALPVLLDKAAHPLQRQSGFAKTGSGRDQGQLLVQAGLQPRQQVWPFQEGPSLGRGRQFGI